MIEEIKKSIEEVKQSRSRFQIEKFVLGQHASREMQYYQVCLELDSLIHTYENTKIELQIIEAKIAKKKEKRDPISELKAKQLELVLERTKSSLLGTEREIAHLIDIWNSFEIKYTRDEIEQSQPEYWQKRLTNSANAMLIGSGQINPAHIEAMDQAGILEDFMVKRIEATSERPNLEA